MNMMPNQLIVSFYTVTHFLGYVPLELDWNSGWDLAVVTAKGNQDLSEKITDWGGT